MQTSGYRSVLETWAHVDSDTAIRQYNRLSRGEERGTAPKRFEDRCRPLRTFVGLTGAPAEAPWSLSRRCRSAQDLASTAEPLVSQRAEHAHVKRIGHWRTATTCLCVRDTPAMCSPGEDKPPAERYEEFGLDGHCCTIAPKGKRVCLRYVRSQRDAGFGIAERDSYARITLAKHAAGCPFRLPRKVLHGFARERT